jgi:hypothetical protein
MEGWARVEGHDRAWERRWDEAERAFYAHDAYALHDSGDELALLLPTPGEPEEWRAHGRVEASEWELRIADLSAHSVIDVRRGRAAWPRTVFRHETEQIGAIRRPRGLGRATWTLHDAGGIAVASVQESRVAKTVGRYGRELAGTALTGVATLGLAPSYERVARADFALSAGDRELGRIHGGFLLDLTADPGRDLDRRLAVAAFAAILLAERD